MVRNNEGWQFLKKLNVDLLDDPAISPLVIHPKAMEVYLKRLYIHAKPKTIQLLGENTGETFVTLGYTK